MRRRTPVGQAEQVSKGMRGRKFRARRSLAVGELVTNAIRYGDPRVRLRLRLIRDRALICEVSDGSSTSPHMRRAHAYDEGGRGLMLVAQLTRRWGSRQTSAGKTIWAEQPLPPAHLGM